MKRRRKEKKRDFPLLWHQDREKARRTRRNKKRRDLFPFFCSTVFFLLLFPVRFGPLQVQERATKKGNKKRYKKYKKNSVGRKTSHPISPFLSTNLLRCQKGEGGEGKNPNPLEFCARLLRGFFCPRCQKIILIYAHLKVLVGACIGEKKLLGGKTCLICTLQHPALPLFPFPLRPEIPPDERNSLFFSPFPETRL